jgi:Putative DNA-binding domain
MPTLAEIQSYFRNAVIDGDKWQVAPMLVGGCEPEKRLAVHQRNYETSLVDALLVKFPATVWLIGTPALTEAARNFIRKHPPQAPCIAEYGTGFPDFLSRCLGAERVPYLKDFAELEWIVGQVAIAVNAAPISGEVLLRIATEALPHTRLTLQPGLRYMTASWPVDELLKLYLTETAPDQLELAPADVWIEVRGARGQFQFDRLAPGDFTFRTAVLEGYSIAEAAEGALEVDNGFDPAQALAALIASGLIIS